MGFPSSSCLSHSIPSSLSYPSFASPLPRPLPLPPLYPSPTCALTSCHPDQHCRAQLFPSNSRWVSPIGRRGLLPLAKRKSNDAATNAEEELDDDLRVGLNEVSTEAVKVMLSENRKLVYAFQEKVDYFGDFLVKEGHLDAARFMLVIRGMLDHKVLPEKDDLKGTYKKAFEKIWSLVEDSGWLLKVDGAETGVEMVDDELIPPILQSQY